MKSGNSSPLIPREPTLDADGIWQIINWLPSDVPEYVLRPVRVAAVLSVTDAEASTRCIRI